MEDIMILFNFRIDDRQLESFNEMCLLTGTDKSHKLRAMINQELDIFWQQQEKVQALRKELYHQREQERSEWINQEISEKNGWVEIGTTHVFSPSY
jgi:hypothetical protein